MLLKNGVSIIVLLAFAAAEEEQLPNKRSISFSTESCLVADNVTTITDFLETEATEFLSPGGGTGDGGVYVIGYTNCTEEMQSGSFDLDYYFVDCEECDDNANFLTDPSASTFSDADQTYSARFLEMFEGVSNVTNMKSEEVENKFDVFRIGPVSVDWPNINLLYKQYHVLDMFNVLTIRPASACFGQFNKSEYIFSSDDLTTNNASLTAAIVNETSSPGGLMNAMPVQIKVDTKTIENQTDVWTSETDELNDIEISRLSFCFHFERVMASIGEVITAKQAVVNYTLQMTAGTGEEGENGTSDGGYTFTATLFDSEDLASVDVGGTRISIDRDIDTDYGIDVYMCYLEDDEWKPIVNALPLPPNSEINVCLYPDSASANDINVNTIKELSFLQTGTAPYKVVTDGAASNELTSLSYADKGITISTRIISRFFNQVPPPDLIVTGLATIEFDTARRERELRGEMDGRSLKKEFVEVSTTLDRSFSFKLKLSKPAVASSNKASSGTRASLSRVGIIASMIMVVAAAL